MSPNPYEITLPQNQWTSLSQTHFHNATDGAVVPQETRVRLKQENATLSIQFECLNNPNWKQNSYSEHNSDLWKQEVFEVFIAEGNETPVRYLEIEINPNNALFASWVENLSGEGDANILTMVAYENVGIDHHITGVTNDSWRGELHIPLQLIHNRNPAINIESDGDMDIRDTAIRGTTLRINFYRIVLLIAQTDPQWECSPDNASFQCWSPTMSGASPRFHRPISFGTLCLE